jgi:hypothetical protein
VARARGVVRCRRRGARAATMRAALLLGALARESASARRVDERGVRVRVARTGGHTGAPARVPQTREKENASVCAESVSSHSSLLQLCCSRASLSPNAARRPRRPRPPHRRLPGLRPLRCGRLPGGLAGGRRVVRAVRHGAGPGGGAFFWRRIRRRRARATSILHLHPIHPTHAHARTLTFLSTHIRPRTPPCPPSPPPLWLSASPTKPLPSP